MKQGKIKQKGLQMALFLLFLLSLPLFQASLLSVETLSPASANLCGGYLQNVTITAQNIENSGNQTVDDVTATLLYEPHNGGVSIVGPSLYLGSITPGILSVNPSWQVQCNDQPGIYTLYVNFSSPQGNFSSQGEAESVITVYANDNTPPLVVNHLPLGVVATSYVTLEVSTNEDATCKYSTIPGVAYANQQYQFQITGGKSHKVSLQDLVDNFYSYYIRCRDTAGNEAQSDYAASIEINAPPTAMMSLSKSSPLSVGTTEVAITTSEPVKPVPTLSYSCSGSSVTVPLTGSGTSWKGYLILSQTNVNEVCSFSFSSVDLSGNAGSYITNGNIFLIDTLPPTAPTALSAVEQRGLLAKLSWKVSSEEIKNFNIYRASDEHPGFSYYGTTTKNSFTDSAVSLGKTYTYHISAIDEAENEGPFSEEVSLLIKGISLDETIIATGNSKPTAAVKLTLGEIDKAIAEADSLLDQFNALRTKFKAGSEELSDNNQVGAVSLLNPSERIKAAKVMLLKKKEELGLLKNADLTDGNAKGEFQAIKEEIGAARNTIISDIRTETEEISSLKMPEEEQLSTILTSYLNKKKPGLGRGEKDAFVHSVQKSQSAITVTATAQKVEITYLNETKEKLTLIKKEVRIEKEANGALDSSELSSEMFSLIEYIPKELVSSVEKMILGNDILGKEVEIIDPDPLLQYLVPEEGAFTYVYLLKKDITADEATKIATVAVPKITSSSALSLADASEHDAKSWDFLTSNAVVDYIGTVSWYDAGIAFGILFIVVIFIYSSIYSEKEVSLRIQHDLPSFDAIRKYFPKRKKKKEGMGQVGLAYPYYAREDYQQAGLTPLLDSTFSFLLKKTEEALHGLDFEKAVKFYHLFCIQSGVPSSKKEKASFSSERVKKKMALFTKHTLLQYAVEKREFMHMRQVLNEIAALYNELFPDATEKEQAFFSFIKKSHDNYSQLVLGEKK